MEVWKSESKWIFINMFSLCLHITFRKIALCFPSFSQTVPDHHLKLLWVSFRCLLWEAIVCFETAAAQPLEFIKCEVMSMTVILPYGVYLSPELSPVLENISAPTNALTHFFQMMFQVLFHPLPVAILSSFLTNVLRGQQFWGLIRLCFTEISVVWPVWAHAVLIAL